MNKVVNLHVAGPIVDEAVVDILRVALDLAERGELENVICFGWCRDGSLFTANSPTDDLFRDMVALRRMEHRLQLALDGGAHDVDDS